MIEAARSGEVVNAVEPSRPQVCLIRSVRVERIIGRRCLPNESGDSPRSCIKQLEARSPLLARNTKTTPSFTMGAIEVCAVEMLAVHKPFACAHLIFDPAEPLRLVCGHDGAEHGRESRQYLQVRQRYLPVEDFHRR